MEKIFIMAGGFLLLITAFQIKLPDGTPYKKKFINTYSDGDSLLSQFVWVLKSSSSKLFPRDSPWSLLLPEVGTTNMGRRLLQSSFFEEEEV